MTTTTAARALADVNAGTITATVWIDAKPERVFSALASQEVAAWWGSAETYRVTNWVGDLVSGGAWRSEGVSLDGGTFSVYGVFLEIDPPHKLALTWNHDWDDSPQTQVSYQLDAQNGGTLVKVYHSGFGDNRVSCEDHARGWERVLEWLRHYADSTPAPVAPV
jgi:uncharacterized protein YndB with AHSA1/START domain